METGKLGSQQLFIIAHFGHLLRMYTKIVISFFLKKILSNYNSHLWVKWLTKNKIIFEILYISF